MSWRMVILQNYCGCFRWITCQEGYQWENLLLDVGLFLIWWKGRQDSTRIYYKNGIYTMDYLQVDVERIYREGRTDVHFKGRMKGWLAWPDTFVTRHQFGAKRWWSSLWANDVSIAGKEVSHGESKTARLEAARGLLLSNGPVWLKRLPVVSTVFVVWENRSRIREEVAGMREGNVSSCTFQPSRVGGVSPRLWRIWINMSRLCLSSPL